MKSFYLTINPYNAIVFLVKTLLYDMKTLTNALKKIPRRTGKIISLVMLATASTILAIILPFAAKDMAAPYEGWDKLIVAIATAVLVVVPAFITFFVGHEWASKKLKGRPINFDGLIEPGTLLPQSSSFFRFMGKHDLGSGWVIALFEKAKPNSTLQPSYPRTLLRSNVFCVLTENRTVPDQPCFVHIKYDQHQRINAITIPDQKDNRAGLN